MTDPTPETPNSNETLPDEIVADEGKRFHVLLVSLSFAVLFLPFLIIASILVPGPVKETKDIVIPHGKSVHEIADILSDNHVVHSSYIFRLAAKTMADSSLKAGEYQFTPHQSTADIVLMMNAGRSVVHLFTVAEGLTSADIVTLLNKDTSLIGDIVPMPPEGTLLPETYRYSYGDTRASLVARMQKDMKETLNDLWEKRDTAVPLRSAYDAIIMASVIEKETGKATERPRIAGVFYNRLRQGMRLQSDPTVIYAITQARGPLDHELDHEDLAFASPISTYTSDGLPSQPICNPGRAAIEAAMHPEKNDYLYFVADGTGGHVFAKDLTEHNQNVTKWNALKSKQP